MNLEDIARTKKALIDFEREIFRIYETGVIRGPIHLAGGNEDELIKTFQEIKKDDWVCTYYRSHYHALLKGIPEDWLKEQIVDGRSMEIMSKDYKFVSSAIVGGQLPIALGIALGIKRDGSDNQVWAFCGDMAASAGMFHECTQYAGGHDLPITFVVEDNGLSIDTPTREVWGDSGNDAKVVRYKYGRSYPHHGTGKWIDF